jgi:hypothetical protein
MTAKRQKSATEEVIGVILQFSVVIDLALKAALVLAVLVLAYRF